jgi:2-dehydropantoate 2-reductase
MQVKEYTDMNIVVFGAGAIGSLFGGLLAKENTVVLVGRTPHIRSIQQKGLRIHGKTHQTIQVSAVENPKDITILPDVVLLTVKSYDTKEACRHIQQLIQDQTMVVSLQNGLDNIEKIGQVIEQQHLLAGVTTHGVLFQEPGVITHTGRGTTMLGELNGCSSERLQSLIQVFNQAGILTHLSTDIKGEIWRKAIVNSSINPLTAFFGCKNGYLLENLVLEKIMEATCIESCTIASLEGIRVSEAEMIRKTKEVVLETAQNSSSMLQSIQQGKETEIDSINGALMRKGKEKNLDVSLNQILVELITSINPKQ